MSKSGKHAMVKATVADILSDGESSFDELRDEMDSWRDSLEEHFSGTDKCERVGEAADALEGASVSEKCTALREALELYGEGQDGQEACPPHVSGTPCAACKWDGVPETKPRTLTVERYDPPRTDYANESGPKIFASVRTKKGRRYYHVGDELRLEEDQRRIAAMLPTITLPKMRTRKVHIEAIPAYADVLAQEVQYGEFQPYKGKSCSRSTRLGNATAAVLAAATAVRAAVESIGADNADDDVAIALDELESAIEELDGIEFPGMYG